MLTRFFALSSAVALLAASQVDAHGHLVVPKGDFGSNKAMMSSFAGRIPDPNTIFTGANFPNTGTKGNYDEFMKHFKGGSQSLKQIIATHNKPLSGATKDCGFTVLGAAKAAPSTMQWGKNEGTSGAEGFRPTHMGACETYCDDTLVQKSDECATSYNAAGNKGLANVPIQSSKCAGAKQLTFYWLATQAKDEGGFQVYVNCIALSGSAGKSSGGNSTAAGDADSDNSKPAAVKPNKGSVDDGSDSGSKKEKTPKSKKPKSSKSDGSDGEDSGKADSGAKKDHKSKDKKSDKSKSKKSKKDSSSDGDAEEAN